MSEYIEREALLDAAVMVGEIKNIYLKVVPVSVVKQASSVKPTVPRGKWSDVSGHSDNKWFACTNCGVWKSEENTTDFCPNCGAKMDGERREDG